MVYNNWNPQQYIGSHSFVYSLGGELLELLAPRQGEYILDVGCGTGQLTAAIRDAGAQVRGIDNSNAMLLEARKLHKDVEFHQGDIIALYEPSLYDAVFSNAVLHWIPPFQQRLAAENVFRALKPGGRFVAEFGGYGNCERIYGAVAGALAVRGFTKARQEFYFPTTGMYRPILEGVGFEIQSIELFERPTPLENGEQGLRDWMDMFMGSVLDQLTPAERLEVMHDVEERLRETWLYNPVQQSWSADYVRIRVHAVRPERALYN